MKFVFHGKEKTSAPCHSSANKRDMDSPGERLLRAQIRTIISLYAGKQGHYMNLEVQRVAAACVAPHVEFLGFCSSSEWHEVCGSWQARTVAENLVALHGWANTLDLFSEPMTEQK